MSKSRVVRYVSGDWNPVLGPFCLRLEVDAGDEPRDFLLAPEDVQPLVVLLLMLSRKVGVRQPPASDEVHVVPLPLDSVGLGEIEGGGIVLRFIIGETALAFALSPGMTCPTSMPSLSSSPWMRGAPQIGFATLIWRMSWRMSAVVGGRPPRDRDFQPQ
jgi:hypothetical protein